MPTLPPSPDRAKLRKCLDSIRTELDRIEAAGEADTAEEYAAAIADRAIELRWLRSRAPTAQLPRDSGMISRETADLIAYGNCHGELS